MKRYLDGAIDLRLSALILLMGFLLIAAAAVREALWLAGEPFPNLTVTGVERDAMEGAIPALVRVLPGSISEEEQAFAEQLVVLMSEGDTSADGIAGSLFDGPQILLASLDAETLDALCVDGRAPVPGAREALAGDLAAEESFELDGETWTVTGRIARSVSGTLYSYVIPETPELVASFAANTDAEQLHEARLYLDGTAVLEGWMAEAEAAPVAAEGAEAGEIPPLESLLMGGMARTKDSIAWMTLLSLVLIAVGGVPLYLRAGKRLLRDAPPMPGMLATEVRRWPRLFIILHVVLFGVFFLAMAEGIRNPLWNLRAMTAVSQIFTEGELNYIQTAYESGNILDAAWATFQNNYILQTFGMTFFPLLTLWATGAGFSLPVALLGTPLPLGVAKTTVSFFIVGFAMSPIWCGTAVGYSFHSVTMVLELEAYVIACFVVLVWPVRLLYGLMARDSRVMIDAGNFLAGGLLVTAGMLGIAALYEAATLILIGG